MNAAVRADGNGLRLVQTHRVFDELQLDLFVTRFRQRKRDLKRRADEIRAKGGDVAFGYADRAQVHRLPRCSADADGKLCAARQAAVERRPGVWRERKRESDDGRAEHGEPVSLSGGETLCNRSAHADCRWPESTLADRGNG
jgi:hypothetical protein